MMMEQSVATDEDGEAPMSRRFFFQSLGGVRRKAPVSVSLPTSPAPRRHDTLHYR